MNIQSKEDLLKFKKEQLVEIIEMCHKSNKYYLKENEILKDNSYHNDEVVDKVNWENRLLKNRIDKAIQYIERNCLEFNVKYACQGLNNDKVDVLLEILRGEDNE